jgi:hypothetical protein
MLLALSWLLTPAAHAGGDHPILLALDLPIVARDLRHDGIPAPQVRTVILGSRERHLHCDEIHTLLLRSHAAIVLNGPVDHFDELVLDRLDHDVRGPELYVYLDDFYGTHGFKHLHDNDLLVVPGGPVPGYVIRADDGPGHGRGNAYGHGNPHGNGRMNGHGNGNGHGNAHGNGHGKGRDK